MPTYLLESYAADRDVLPDARERAIRAAESGTGVRYLRTTLLPEEHTLLLVFEAASPDALQHAAHLAGLSYDRIVEAVEGGAPDHPDQ